MSDREFSLTTSLNPEQIVDALKRRSEIAGANVRPTGALFEASSISSQRFEVKLLARRNHLKAHIHGEIAGTDSGSKVSVRIGAIDPFGAVWSAVCVLAALVALTRITSWSQAPAALGVATAAAGLLMSYRVLSRRALDLDALTAESALKEALAATTSRPAINGA